jgi:CheY-like chemotaxis protein
VASEILQGAGLKVSLANNGQEAVTAIQKNAYDAVLMDVQMPVMNGYTATRKIREWELQAQSSELKENASAEYAGTGDQQPAAIKGSSVPGTQPSALPIIAMTAHAMAGDAEKSIAAGMSDHVTKPIDPQQLFATLRKWIQPDKSRAHVEPQEAPGAIESPAKTVFDVEGLPESLPGFDLADGLKRLQGNKKLYRKLLLDLGAKYAGAADDIRQALAVGDFEQAHSLVHNLKGLSGNLAATDLQAAAAELEKEVKGGRQKKLSEQQLNQALTELDKALQTAHNSVRALGPAAPEKPDKPPDTALTQISPELARQAADRIREAAEMGDVTRIKTITEDYKSKSEDFATIAARFIQMAADFDFEGILKLADELDKSQPA